MMTIDYVVLGIIILGLVIGIYKGFIKMVFGMLGTVTSLVGAYFLSPWVADFLVRSTGLNAHLQEKIGEMLQLDNHFTETMSKQAQIEGIKGLPLPEGIKSFLINNNNSKAFDLIDVSGINQYVQQALSRLAINVLAFVVTFLLLLVIVAILAYALDLVSKLPVLNQINRLAGGVTGLVFSVLIVWVVMLFLSFFFTTGGNQQLLAELQQSVMAKWFYEYNFLNLLLKQKVF